jgi:hypothetical protein
MKKALEVTLADLAKMYQTSNENIKIAKMRFTHSSRHCDFRHPTGLYCNCNHPKADADMPNCLIDECPLREEI